MQRIRITKQFNLEMAHALNNYDGPCNNIHGHSYVLFVTIIGEPSSNEEDTKHGMVMDFRELKSIIKGSIISKYDHKLILNKKTPDVIINNIKKAYKNVVIVDYQPTCENLLIHFVKIVQKNLKKTIKLHSAKLAETTESYAEWYAEDN